MVTPCYRSYQVSSGLFKDSVPVEMVKYTLCNDMKSLKSMNKPGVPFYTET